MQRNDMKNRVAFAAQLARDAGALALRYFRRELAYTAESKGEQQDWVSVADRAVEALCRAQIAANFPHDAMLGEETGGALGDSVGIYNRATAGVFLRNTNTAGPGDVSFVYGPAGVNWQPIIGDWNGPTSPNSSSITAASTSPSTRSRTSLPT